MNYNKLKFIWIFIIFSLAYIVIPNVNAASFTDVQVSCDAANCSDTELKNGASAGTNFGTAGSINFGGNSGSGTIQRIVMNFTPIFDIIPISSTIDELKIECKASGNFVGIEDDGIYEILTNMSEDEMTWDNWNSGGINMTDFNGTQNLVTNTFPASPGLNARFNYTISTSYAQRISDETALGGGSVLIINTPSEAIPEAPCCNELRSSDFGTAADRCKWYVSYTEITADLTSPTIDSTAINNTTPFINDIIQISGQFTDETALSFIFYANNLTGTFTNQSSIDVTSQSTVNYTVNITNTLSAGNVVGSIFTVNDTSGNDAQSSIITYTVAISPDTNNPNFDEQSQNDTFVQRFEVINVSIFLHDDTALDTVTFSHNQTGTLTNVSTLDISGTDFNATFPLQITNVRSHQIAYQFTFNDTNGNDNQTGLFQFEIQNTPPETPTIIFPTEGLITFLQPLDINVTFPADVDLDGLRIDYFIDDILNQSSFTNTTLNASDNSYNLKVSINDGTVSSSNVSVSFTIDTINPIVTINEPINNSFHNSDITVDLVCTNINLNNLSYVFHNTSNIIQTEFNATNGLTQSTLKEPILTAGLGDGVYNFNVSCTDNASLTINQFLLLNIDNNAPIVDSTAISNSSPVEDDIIGINVTCSDSSSGLATINVANNVTGTLTNVSTSNFNNVATGTFEFNHTAILGFISHQFTCSDALSNQIQSGLVNYNSSAAPPPPPAITGFATGTSGILVTAGTIAITLMVVIGIFIELVFRPIRKMRKGGK